MVTFLVLVALLVGAPLVSAADGPDAKQTSKSPPPPPPPPPEGEVIRPAPPPAPDKRPAKEAELDREQLSGGIEDRKPVLGPDTNAYELQAYCYVLEHARDVPADKLKKAARRDVTFSMLWNDSPKYRGDLLHIEGRLSRLTPYDAPRRMSREAGIPTIYEGWIFAEDSDNPYCVVFTDLPAGVTPGDKISYYIRCDAYYFKLFGYQDKKKQWRATPVLLGRTFTLEGIAPMEKESVWSGLSQSYIYAGILMFLVLVVLLGSLNWWFRRGDRDTRRQLEAVRPVEFIELGSDEEPRKPAGGENNPDFDVVRRQ